MNECCNKSNTFLWVIAILISIGIGVLVGVFYANGTIANIINLVQIALILAGGSIAILGGSIFTASILKGGDCFQNCVCKNGKWMLASIIGVIIAGTFSATYGIVRTEIISIVAVALTAFFFSLLIMSIIFLMCCLLKRIGCK